MSDMMTITGDILKMLLPDSMIYRGSYSNIDILLAPGIYSGSGTSSSGTFPTFGHMEGWLFGTLEVIKSRGDRIIHRLTSDRGDVAVRVWLNSSWQAWKAMTPVA